MPVLISSLKTNSRGGNSQTKLNAPCLSDFSAKPHFMLRSLDDDTAFRLPGRVGARPLPARRMPGAAALVCYKFAQRK